MFTKFINSAATNNAQLINTTMRNKGIALWTVDCFNAGAGVAFVKFYNTVSAPAVGSDVPVLVLAIPAAGTTRLDHSAGAIQFNQGLGMAIVTGAADTDNTAVAANQVKVAISYGG